MQKQKEDIIDILFSHKTLSLGYKILKAIIVLYFSIFFTILDFHFMRLHADIENTDLFVYIYILAFALYFSFIYFLMVKASKEFLVGLILLAYFIGNLLFFPIPYKEIFSIISLLFFLYYIFSVSNKEEK